MKRIFFILIVLFSFFRIDSNAQSLPDALEFFHHVNKLILNDSISELASLVNYPLHRKNPLPDISSQDDFKLYYPILFDSIFKMKLKNFNDSNVWEHEGLFGLVGGAFSGDIWIEPFSKKIITINYRSAQELQLSNKLTSEIQNNIYPSVRSWKENILVCKSVDYLVRIDLTDSGLRYVAWSQGHKISEKPDLILYNGDELVEGTMRGFTWTFNNGDWTYEVDEVDMCEDMHPENCGLFLRVLYKDTEQSKTRMNYTK